jgi:hypothetical protein
MAKKNYDLLFKLLLIGDSGVGKVSEYKTYVWLFESIFVSFFRHVFYFDFLMINLVLHLFPRLALILK